MLKVDIQKVMTDFALTINFSLGREILVLFGPSGAGKSLTLSCIAGLTRPDMGYIQLDSRVLFNQGPSKVSHKSSYIPAYKRNIGIVFQDYALFPHLTVVQNIAYGLRYHRNIDPSEISPMLHHLRLEQLANRYPHQLSGGQQQRVALGRALILKPELLLLDEPFAALDLGVREQLQRDILAFQQALGLTIIYVTHQLEDTFVLGDKLAVIRGGKLEQFGSLSEVFHRPNSRTVAEITGVKNIGEGVVKASRLSGLEIQWGECIIKASPVEQSVGDRVIFYIRPEHIKIIHPDKSLTDMVRFNLFDATIERVMDRRTHISLMVQIAGAPEPLQLRFPVHSYEDMALQVGGQIKISLLRGFVRLIPKNS